MASLESLIVYQYGVSIISEGYKLSIRNWSTAQRGARKRELLFSTLCIRPENSKYIWKNILIITRKDHIVQAYKIFLNITDFKNPLKLRVSIQ